MSLCHHQDSTLRFYDYFDTASALWHCTTATTTCPGIVTATRLLQWCPTGATIMLLHLCYFYVTTAMLFSCCTGHWIVAVTVRSPLSHFHLKACTTRTAMYANAMPLPLSFSNWIIAVTSYCHLVVATVQLPPPYCCFVTNAAITGHTDALPPLWGCPHSLQLPPFCHHSPPLHSFVLPLCCPYCAVVVAIFTCVACTTVLTTLCWCHYCDITTTVQLPPLLCCRFAACHTTTKLNLPTKLFFLYIFVAFLLHAHVFICVRFPFQFHVHAMFIECVALSFHYIWWLDAF